MTGRVAVALTAALAALLVALPTSPAAADDVFPAERLEQLVAPIALYPDPLLMNILMASTYPLEVVQADRWAQSNKGMEGAALDDALAAQTWDDSVKSLAKLPDVVGRMSQNLDWTTDLGEAFLAQQADVLDAIQRMRQKASAQGNLQTSKEQQVVVEKEVIKIVPADPQVIYVPTYSAPVVYGSAWSYPTNYYPAMYTYPPGYVATTSLLSFGVGVAVGAAVWGSADWGGHNSYCCGGWGHGHNDVDIDINRNVNINNTNISNKKWEHNVEHRRGAAYKNDQTRERYRDGDAGRRDLSREQARGHASEGGVDRAAAAARQRDGGQREGVKAASPAAGAKAKAGAADRPRAQEQARGSDHSPRAPQAKKPERAAGGGGDRGGKTSGFSGGSGKSERAASARGSESRSQSHGGGQGGAKRSGGGGGGQHSGGGGSRGGGGGHGGGGHGGGRKK